MTAEQVLARYFYEAIIATGYITDPELRDAVFKELIFTNRRAIPQQLTNGQTPPSKRRKKAAEEVAEDVAQEPGSIRRA